MDFDYEDILEKCSDVGAVIIGNPNNPNGNIIDEAKFKDILDFCEKQNKTVIIDEAFIEFTGDIRDSFIIEMLSYKCIFIIRALTKFFSMPGVRFGYGISSNLRLMKYIKERQNPWSINCFAELAVKYALEDDEYINRSLEWIRIERKFFIEELQK